MLEAAGLRPAEEVTYRALVAARTATVAELAAAGAAPSSALPGHLRRLVALGLATTEAERPRRYTAVPPTLAVEALVLREEEELHRRAEELARLRLSAAALAKELEGTTGASLEFVEVLQGREALARRFAALQSGAREEVLGFEKPPYVIHTAGRVEENPDEMARLRQGVAFRILYDRSALEMPGKLAEIEQYVAAGEEARVHPKVPMKLAVVDRRVALIPLNLDDPYAASGVIIHESSLLQALVMLFETLWERAQPLSAYLAPRAAPDPRAAPSPEDRRLLALLASGMKDQAIARQLGLGHRTVARRVAVLLDELGAATRFAGGLEAGRRGWL